MTLHLITKNPKIYFETSRKVRLKRISPAFKFILFSTKCRIKSDITHWNDSFHRFSLSSVFLYALNNNFSLNLFLHKSSIQTQTDQFRYPLDLNNNHRLYFHGYIRSISGIFSKYIYWILHRFLTIEFWTFSDNWKLSTKKFLIFVTKQSEVND